MKTIILILAIAISNISYSQVATSSDLHLELATLDSLIFVESFNNCNHEHLESIISTSLEFYHDQGGLSDNKGEFIKSIERNICGNPAAKPIRDLVDGTLQVFPLYDQGELYGAVQMGQHEFYIKEPGKELYLTSTAKFTHLWIQEDSRWQLKRVLSYDHQSPQH
jgi:hypothetical protein